MASAKDTLQKCSQEVDEMSKWLEDMRAVSRSETDPEALNTALASLGWYLREYLAVSKNMDINIG